jgi:transposase
LAHDAYRDAIRRSDANRRARAKAKARPRTPALPPPPPLTAEELAAAQCRVAEDPFWRRVRRRLAGELRAAGHEDQAKTLGKGLWALRKKPGNLTGSQRTALAGIKRDNRHLYTGYLIKEQVREMFKVKGKDGKALLTGVISWAQRSRIPEMARYGKTLAHYKPLIGNTLDGGPSNGRAEALNSQLNALITRARGFRSATALMNMASFVHGGICPDSPYA